MLLRPDDTTYFEPYIYLRSEDITSKVIPGFTIPVSAVFDEQVNMAALKMLMGG